MDGRTLMEIMQSPNFAMWGPAEQAFNTTQEKAKADLATTLGLEQRNQAMHPLEMAGKDAVTRLNNSTAAMNEDVLRRRIPAEDERKAALQASIAKMDDTSRAQMKAQVVRNMQLAAMMEKNGGMLPQGFNLSPEEMQIFQPKNLKNIIAHGQAFLEMDPEEISKRRRAAEAEKLAKIRGQVQMDVKGTPSAGGNTKPPAPAPGSNEAIVADLAKFKEARQALQRLKIWYPQMTPEQKQQWLPVIASLKKQAENEPLLPGQGKVDPVATANDPKGGVAAKPAIDLGGAPGAVANRPQRQQPAVNPKDITPENIAFTAKELGISEEEVKKRLGIK